ncbi:MAG: hypothetical protein ACRDH1_13170 [Actinomycetota bacterium]
MDWLALVVLGIIWAVLLVPGPGKRSPDSPLRREVSVEEEEFRQPGRWILSPKRGSRFIGRHERTRMRARERRRQVYVFLLEAIGLTGLMGLFPPLRGMLLVTGFLVALMAAYTLLVIRVSRFGPARPTAERQAPGQVVVVLPEARPEPEFDVQEQDRRVVRIAAK